MDFKDFSFPRRQFPRFDYAYSKAVGLRTRYDNLLREESCTQEMKNAIIVLCKRKGDEEFPVDINSLISDTSYSSKVQKGNTFDSSNIEDFSRSLKQSDESVCVFIVDSKEKSTLSHLCRDNINVIAINDDAKIEIEAMYQSKLNVMIVKSENLKSEIDNLLERISLAPLKQICEHCYTMFKKKTSTSIDTNVSRNRIEGNMLATCGEQEHQSSGHHADESLDLHARQNHLKETHKFQVSNTSTQNINGSAKFAETSWRPKTCQHNRKSKHEVTKRYVPYSTATTIYKRTRSHFKANGKIKDHSDADMNGYKSQQENTRHTLRKSNSDQINNRPIENDEIQKAKKRKEENLEQTSSRDHTTEEDPEHLLEAILAVYGMSNVPKSERPNVPKQSKIINEQMKEELFKICPTIKRMGYRYRTFHIYAVQPVRHEDEEFRNNKIHSVLKKYELFSYKIAHCNEEMQELMHTGAKIEARSDTHYSLRSRKVSRPEVTNGGTLGGFVKTNEGNQQYCLLAKHVTEHCSNIFYVGNGNNKFLGHMLPQTNDHVHGCLDISAALLKDPIGEGSTKFKDTRGTPLKGKLHEYNDEDEDNICRSGQSVHIHGAMTKPGIGEITMPIVYNGLSSPLIQVEDIKGDGAVHIGGYGAAHHFADKGDSGVVMCVEDPERKHVHALGMVMGEISKGSQRRKYLALPLSKGIQQIAEQTNTRLELM